jgi:hypothetical protein
VDFRLIFAARAGRIAFAFAKETNKMILATLMILAAAAYRLAPHPWNVAPVCSMAFCGGLYLGKRWALLVPLAAMLVSDIFLGFSIISAFVYGCYIASGFIGLALRERRTLPWITGGTVAGSVLFFVITNFATWALTNLYPHTVAGLVRCYDMAIPFFRGTLAGDVLFTSVFVAVMEFARRPARRVVTA